ncbi:Uncharacterised protein [Mycobacteroides abscessus subsp. abscessus]|uniref:hypothetical protein n=1 Tax=Mycobacteroides abscessus TaxID=36809 RepID=UPI0009A77430|nr:hypothetical protein [Mycobacteroides abscessus]MBN7388556.1 hypothetical protein [Mycobacteroides abscessus subsp. abscessus]MBN7414826.1 hypothetical protein [Mycobacteroides abscessus subsp. abscessus]MDO2961022.1 hypothetical protein [Mycobacteroides abscessus subsp. abscessus]MDO2994990.1 hypothetical protein [Mycobacteroides abscessus subsp. abscessus]MDO3064357.1 hypothetical protein [Mycobacteroides abscessus subsp. abscessus]
MFDSSSVTLESAGISPLATLAFAPKPELRSLALELPVLPKALVPESRTSWGRLAFEILSDVHGWLRPLHQLIQTSGTLEPITGYLEEHPRLGRSSRQLAADIQRVIGSTDPADPYLRESLITLVQGAWNAAVDRFENDHLPAFRPPDADEQLVDLAAAIAQIRSMALNLRADEHHGFSDALSAMLTEVGFPLSARDRVLDSVATGEPMKLRPLGTLPADIESED